MSPASATARQIVADLYAASRNKLYEYLVTLGCLPDTAQELTQEAFLRLHMSLRAGKSIEHPKAWVYRVAHNLALDRAGSTSRETVLSEAIVATLASRDHSAERTLLESERRSGFQAAFQNLSKQQRLCLELRAEGLRYREIAAALGIRTSTVGQFLQRAVTRLKKWSRDRDETLS